VAGGVDGFIRLDGLLCDDADHIDCDARVAHCPLACILTRNAPFAIVNALRYETRK
jgi:hypothetical protein